MSSYKFKVKSDLPNAKEEEFEEGILGVLVLDGTASGEYNITLSAWMKDKVRLGARKFEVKVE